MFLKNFKPIYLIWLALLIYIPLETRDHQDFDIFLSATKDFMAGGNIFENTYDNGFHFFYSPLFATLLIPFTFLPVHVARIIWLCLNILAFARCFKLLKSYFSFGSFTEKQQRWFDVITIVFSAKLILDNFHNGQVTIFMLLFMLEGLRLIKNKKALWGAALIALGINFKFLPLVLLPYLFYNKELKACALIVVWYVVFLYLPVGIHGYAYNNELLHSWFKEINPAQQQHLIDTGERTLNGLTTLIPTLLMDKVPDQFALPDKRNILSLDVSMVLLIINIVRLGLILFFLYFLRRKIFQPTPNKQHAIWELGYLFMLIPLIFPHQQHYAFFLMMPASMYVIYQLFIMKQQNIPLTKYIVVMAVIYLLTNAHLLLGEFRQYYNHYKIITYGALLMIPLLALLKPVESKERS